MGDCTISGTPTKGQGALPYKVTADIGSDTVSGELRIRVLFQPRYAYSANTGSNNVSAYSINADGSLNTLPNYTFGSSANPIHWPSIRRVAFFMWGTKAQRWRQSLPTR